jgi:hypothetical protein
MRPKRTVSVLLGLCTASSVVACLAAPAAAPSPEARALAYLSREVPRWPAEKKCFSCHNSGDGMRALLEASRHKHDVPPAALRETLAWLTQPEQWDKREEKSAPREKTLARIHFAATLLEAHDAGRVRDAAPLRRAADLVAELQQADGSWWVEEDGSLGTPVTYGITLATYEARRLLQRVEPDKHREVVARAEGWLRRRPVHTLLDAAGVLLALEGDHREESRERKRQCFQLIRKGEDRQGGWGPYANAPPEPFDTALLVLALSRPEYAAANRTAVRRGRAYLVGVQADDGSWPETTRPAGAESYAERISTTAWATRALLATAE